MRFFTLHDLAVNTGIDVSNYTHSKELNGVGLSMNGSLRMTAPTSWNIEQLLQNIRTHKPFDQLLYCNVQLSATDSTTSLLPADCFLIELPYPGCTSLFEKGDESMPLLTRSKHALFICFSNKTMFSIPGGKYLINDNGTPTVTDSLMQIDGSQLLEQSDDYILEF